MEVTVQLRGLEELKREMQRLGLRLLGRIRPSRPKSGPTASRCR